MPVIINEIEVIAPPLKSEETQQEVSPQRETDLTPHDLYLVKRKMIERRTRLLAR